jgi:regulatory protein
MAEARAAARRAATALLARREHSRHEINQKLKKKGHPAAIVAEVAEQLAQEGKLSDNRFAESLAHSRRGRGQGPVRIRRELAEKGVGSEVVAELVDASAPDWLRLAETTRRKKFGEALPATAAERARQARFLQYRGFTSEQIRRALRGEDD